MAQVAEMGGRGRPSPRQLDRAAGVLLGAACGDALGVPYEFARPPGPAEMPVMKGGGLGPYAPGEYSDDTQMAACIARVAATGLDLRSEDALDQVAANFLDWAARAATDIGAQTSAVLSNARHSRTARPAGALRTAATQLHERTGRTAGNGSLMRTGVVALAYLDDPDAMAEAARAVSDLTHPDPLAGDACVLWCAAIRRAVLDAALDGMSEGLDLLPRDARSRWAPLLAEAEQQAPSFFSPNGFVVTALQAAWSAVVNTPVPDDEPARAHSPASTWSMRWLPRSAPATTPTRWRRSPARCSARAGVLRPSRSAGSVRCTAGQGCAPPIWCGFPC